MHGEQTVAGLRCSEVLAQLSDFVDQTLDSVARDRILQHLRGCDRCERFGGRFATLVGALRQQLGEARALDTAVETRLRAALDLD